MLLKNFLTGLAALSLSATAFASPAPMSRNEPSKTSLTKRALEIPVCLTVDLGTVNLSGIVNGLLDTVTAASLDSINDALGLPLSVLGVVAIPRITLLSELDAVLDNPLLAAVVGTVSGTIDAAVQLVDDVTAIANLPGIGAVNLNDADLGGLCLCLTADALDPANLLQIRTALTGDGGILGGASDEIVNPILEGLEPVLLDILQNANDQIAEDCAIPDNASAVVENCARVGDDCPVYTCDEGFEACGDFCVTIGTECVSGIPSRKRSVRERSRFACRQPFTACPVSHFLARGSSSSYGGGFECIDTTSNLESCGGCISPFSGNAAGEDCTAIANVDSVSCTRGTCVVDSCASGFVPSAGGKSCEAASRFSSSRLTVQGRRLRK